MDWIDWLLSIGLVALLAVLIGMAWPPYGYAVGLLIGAFVAWQALKRRRRMLDRESKDEKTNGKSG